MVRLLVLRYAHLRIAAQHPAPWPYTHLAQFFLVVWVYTLPVCLVSIYGHWPRTLLPKSLIGLRLCRGFVRCL